MEWRLRITGTRLEYITAAKMAGEEGDYPNNPRQSSLYNWGRDKTLPKGIRRTIDQVEKTVARVKVNSSVPPPNHLSTELSTLASNIQALNSEVVKLDKSINGLRLKVSLRRFDGWFQLFLRSQNLRWFIVEFLLPVLLGLYALFLLA